MSKAVGLVAMMELGKSAEHIPIRLLLEGILTTEVVYTKPGDFDGGAAFLVREDVTIEQWKAIVKVVRLKFGKAELPLYEKNGSSWRYAVSSDK